MKATKAPPMIVPGTLCPKCKGPVTDERANKRTDKSPDYQCANVTCTDPTGKFRTGVWLDKKANGVPPFLANQEAEDAAELRSKIGTEKPKLAGIYLEATKFVLESVVPLYEKAKIGVSDTAVAAMVATLFIAKSKEL